MTASKAICQDCGRGPCVSDCGARRLLWRVRNHAALPIIIARLERDLDMLEPDDDPGDPAKGDAALYMDLIELLKGDDDEQG